MQEIKFVIIVLICSGLFYSCVIDEKNNYVDKGGYLEIPSEIIRAKVYKVIYLEEHYLIYVCRGRTKYKILSRKYNINKECNQIQLDSTYIFILKKDMDAWTNYNEFRCIGTTKVAFKEGGFRGLYYPQNMKGLCLFPSEIPLIE
jgi:hypothetical protein